MYLRLDEPAAVKDDSVQMFLSEKVRKSIWSKNFLTCLYYKSVGEESQNKLKRQKFRTLRRKHRKRGGIKPETRLPSLRKAKETDILKETVLCIFRGENCVVIMHGDRI